MDLVRLRQRPWGNGCLLLFYIPFVLAGIFMVFWAIKSWTDYAKLSDRGEVTMAKVSRKWISSGENSDTPMVEYAFEVNGGHFSNSGSVDWGWYEELQPGSDIEIIYVSDEPSISQIGDDVSTGQAIGITCFALFWNVFICFHAFLMLRGSRQGSG